jgi:hypothetical protein
VASQFGVHAIFVRPRKNRLATAKINKTKNTEPNNGPIATKANTIKTKKNRIENFKNLRVDGSLGLYSFCEYGFWGCLLTHHKMNGNDTNPITDAIVITITN